MPILNEQVDEQFCKEFLSEKSNSKMIELIEKFEPKGGSVVSFTTAYNKLVKNLEINKKEIPQRLCEVFEYNFMNLYSKMK